MIINRLIKRKIEKKIKYSGCVLIQGPKYVGKSYISNQISKSSFLLKPDEDFIKNIKLFPEIALDGESPHLVDEWQYCPFLWDIVKEKIDHSATKGLYIFTGSSTPTDKTERHDGAGRFSEVEIENLTLQEMGYVEKKIEFLSLFEENSKITHPILNGKNNKENIAQNFTWLTAGGFVENFALEYNENECISQNRDYIKQICKRNKREQENTVLFSFSKNIMGLVFEEIARNTGQELNVKATSERLGISYDTIKKYIDIIDHMHLLKKLVSWRPHILSNAKIINSPKLYLFDPCIALAALKVDSYSLLTGKYKLLSNKRSNYDDAGFFFESQVIKQLRVFCNLIDAELSFYRDTNHLEIDAIVEYEHKIAIFEIKVGSYSAIEDGIKNINKFREVLTTDIKKTITSWNIITAEAESYHIEKENINVISINHLFIEEEKI